MPLPASLPADNSLRVAALLTLSGGFLDAFTFVGHGQVFANAMTGNIVLMGIAVAAQDWAQALRHVPPLLAFIAGVFLANCLRLPRVREIIVSPALVCLALEIVMLGIGSQLPADFPDAWLVPGIALVAAMQNSSFTHIGSSPYNSVMTTGNLRRSIESLFKGITHKMDEVALHEARVFGLVCLCFLLGAVLGGICTLSMDNLALTLPVLMLVVAFGICLYDARAQRQ
ncbi:YoaK family protein [Methylobacillus sp. Pita2]|uniref:YoaK family protein n=1 Tax=Methylobacillus sp. Pita2 TaxID=3383245 RepID=UPI0038B6775C